MAQEPWGGRALAPWCGMAPWFWGHMAPEVEAGRAVSPAAAEAEGEWGRAASADENSCFTGGWTYRHYRQIRRFKQGLTRVEATFNVK